MRHLLIPAAALAVLVGFARVPSPGRLPAIVFVSRHPVAGEPHAIPGLGPAHRAVVTGGRLLVREPDGRLRALLPDGALLDVADPAVSFDGRRVAFAGTPHADSGWRIYAVRIEGGPPRPITGVAPGSGDGAERAGGSRYDDLDPCWLSDSVLCFASTREGRISPYAGVPVTNLWTVRADGSGLARITAERNGAEEPALDPATGRLIYARWWFNAWRAARRDPSGLTTDPEDALGDSVNLWQAVELAPAAGSFRLAAGAIRTRRESMGYQPAVLADGTVVGVYAAVSGLWPHPGPTGVQSFPGRYGRSVRIAGAALADAADHPYHDARGLAAPSACAPAALPDGRVAFALDPGARGDFGLWCSNPDGSHPAPIVDLPGTLELDPAAIVARPHAVAVTLAPVAGGGHFDFLCRNVFATGPLDGPVGDAPALAAGLRLRFFEALSRADRARGDSAVLIREVPVAADGSIRATALPAHVPMFEQLVDARGRAVMTTRGPAHVAGFNFGAPGTTLRCVGCHVGHSSLAPGDPAGDASWFNASPSATVTSSGEAPGSRGARAAVDGRTRGAARDVCWIAGDGGEPALRLDWPLPIEVRELVIHPPRPDRAEGTDVRIERCEVRFLRGGAEVGRVRTGRLAPSGTRVPGGTRVIDAVEISVLERRGRVAGHPAAALAEIETLARPATTTAPGGAARR